MDEYWLRRVKEVNWSIALPIIIAVGAMCYLFYQVATEPGSEVEQTLSVTLQRFGKTLLKRDSDDLLRYCSHPAVKQCTDLLATIASRERRDPTFRFTRFTIPPRPGESLHEITSSSPSALFRFTLSHYILGKSSPGV